MTCNTPGRGGAASVNFWGRVPALAAAAAAAAALSFFLSVAETKRGGRDLVWLRHSCRPLCVASPQLPTPWADRDSRQASHAADRESHRAFGKIEFSVPGLAFSVPGCWNRKQSRFLETRNRFLEARNRFFDLRKRFRPPLSVRPPTAVLKNLKL